MTKPHGRPTKYTEELATEILERLAGGENLRGICADHDLHPSTVSHWAIDDRESFAARYDRALKARAMLRAEEIVEIADDCDNDVMVANDGSVTLNLASIARARLRIDARKWVMAREYAGRYGNKVQVGGEGGGPVKVQIVRFGEEDTDDGT